MRFTDQHIRNLLVAEIERDGLRATARNIGRSPTFLSLIAEGKSPPGPHIAQHFGFVEDGMRWVARKGIKK